MNQGLLLLLVFKVGYLTSLSQSDQFSSDILEARKQLVYSNHADSYVAHFLTGRRLSESEIKSKQLFLDKRPVVGSLVFDGVLFEDIELQYNLYTQQVIALLETENTERYVTLTPDKVTKFSIYGHKFIQVQGDSVMAEGLYELAFAGAKSSVFIKHANNKKETIKDGKVRNVYFPVNKYYVKNEFGSFHITGRKKLVEAYQNSEHLISILKKNNIKFSKKKMAQALVTAISYLETGTTHSN